MAIEEDPTHIEHENDQFSRPPLGKQLLTCVVALPLVNLFILFLLYIPCGHDSQYCKNVVEAAWWSLITFLSMLGIIVIVGVCKGVIDLCVYVV